MAAKVDGFVFSEAPAAPQKKAQMKKPQRTKASVSSSAPSHQRKAKASKAKKKAFATHVEQMLLAAVLKFGNNYQLAKLAGTTPDILSRFARQERTLRLDTAGQVAAALGMLMVALKHPLREEGHTWAQRMDKSPPQPH